MILVHWCTNVPVCPKAICMMLKGSKKVSKLKEIYIAILKGEMQPFDAADVLQKWNKTVQEDDEVEVVPKYIILKLNLYLEDKINEEQLSEWAAFIVTMEGFETPHWKDDYDLADNYDPMWEILQRLSTPHLDGWVNKELAKDYIAVLKKIPQ